MMSWVQFLATSVVLWPWSLLSQAPSAPPQSAGALFQEADRELKNHHPEKAVPLYRRALRLEPSNAGGWSNLGSAYFALNDLRQAERQFARAVAVQPSSPDYQFNLGMTRVEVDRCAAARPDLQVAARNVNYTGRARYLLAVCDLHARDWAELGRNLDGAIAAGYDPPEVYFLLIQQARQTGNTSRAALTFDLLANKYPDSSFLYEIQGNTLEIIGESNVARESLQKAIQEAPHTPLLHFQLGVLEWRAGNFDRAESEFQKELSIAPRSPAALSFLGDIEMQRGDLAAAESSLRTSIAIDPKDPEAQARLGKVLFLQKRLDEAKACLTASVHLDRDRRDAHYYLAQIYKHLDNSELAREEFTEVQRINDAERKKLLGGNRDPAQ